MVLFATYLILYPGFRLLWGLGRRGENTTLPWRGPLILAANHASFLDPWFLGFAFLRPIRYLIDHEWWNRSAVWRCFFRASGTFPVRARDPRGTVDAVCRQLQRGAIVGLFPEGGISHDGRIRRFHSGVSWAAAKSGAPVLPVGIRGAFEALPRSRRIPRPGQVTLHVGSPMVYPGSPVTEDPSPAELSDFSQTLRREICRLAAGEE